MNCWTTNTKWIKWCILITVSIIVVVPATFKLPMMLTLLKLDGPDTFKDGNNVDAPETNK